jgi:hypothetical protein
MIAENLGVLKIGRVRFLVLICGYVSSAFVIYSIVAMLMLKVILKVAQVSSGAANAYLILAIVVLGGGLLYAWLRFFRRVLVPRLMDIGFRSPVTYFIVCLLFIPGINALIFLGMALMPANFVRE